MKRMKAALVSIEVQHFISSISVITKEYVKLLSFVVDRTFDVFSQIEG